jgi:hypothetical protein
MSTTETKPLRRVSVDLESLGVRPDALILSIGAVAFDPVSGTVGDPFYMVVDHSKTPLGSISHSTVDWWMNQSEEARAAVFGKDVQRAPLAQALVAFSEYLGFDDSLPDGEYPNIQLWVRGNIDPFWLQSAYDGLGLAAPFQFWHWKDQRTWCAEFKPFLPERAGVHHNALDDAEYQAQCINAVYQRLYSMGTLVPGDANPVQDEVDRMYWNTLEAAYVCGLATVGEAIDNVILHATSLWLYDQVQVKQDQLYTAFDSTDHAALVVDLLGPERVAKLDQEQVAAGL